MTHRAVNPALDDALHQVRAAYLTAALTVNARELDVATFTIDLAALRETHAADDPAVAQKASELDEARRILADARGVERNAREGVRFTLQNWLPGDATEVSRCSAAQPFVLLPLRIETRFVRQPSPALLVRVYPDEIAVNTHDIQLTAAESAAGVRYWETAKTDEREAWREIIRSYPVPRAAWIVRDTAPPSIEDDKDFHLFLPPRFSSWSRPATVSQLADRWHVLAYRGGTRVASATGNAIADPLFVSLDPKAAGSDLQDVSGHGLEIDRDLAWTIDFEEAVKAGMAVRVPVGDGDLANGFDQLFVLGVKASVDPSDIGWLFDGHHYTRGWSFLRQGTPLHNTSETRSPFPADDPDGGHSFPIERGAPLPKAGSNGLRFAAALGIAPNLVNHIENADLLEDPHAQAFNNALWPGTFGYFARQMLDPFVDDPFGEGDAAKTFRFGAGNVDTVDAPARRHFVGYVRGIAALPPFRIGNQAYALLPVTSLSRWQPSTGAEPFDTALPPLLQTLLSSWSSRLGEIPRVGRSGDVEADLLATLGLNERTRRVWVRQGLGPTAHYNFLAFLGLTLDRWNAERAGVAASAMAAIGHSQWDPFLAWMSFRSTADLFAHELVAPIVSEETPLDPNYIQWLRTASVDALRHETFAGPVPHALLYHVLRYAIACEYDRLGFIMSLQPAPARFIGSTMRFRPDAELLDFPGSPWATGWSRLNGPLPIGGGRIADFLTDPARDHDGSTAGLYRQSLATIEALPTAELERLFTSTLDTFSHRLDAWITSLASKRLQSMRTQKPNTSYRGAYGWVEDLRPLPKPRTQTLDDGRVAIVQEDGGGYIDAPTMTHATAAAQRSAIDLSPDRVRKALRLLEKVRSGESLASALGHQFERALRPNPSVIEALRNRYPLVANKRVDSHQPADAVAAPNVVDGLRLLDEFRKGTVIDPLAVNELRDLDDTINAIADLLTAESVFQSARGNTVAASAALDAMARGLRPPEIECVRQPRGGTPLTHRFAIVLGAAAPNAPLWTAPASPRSIAEPHLDQWIGALLGDPSRVRCRITFSVPFVAQPVERVVSLADLQIRPIDFLALADESPDPASEPTELDRRIGAGSGSDVQIDHAPWPDHTIRNFPEAIAVARAIRTVIAAARPLRPEDLVPPEKAAAAKNVATSTNNRGAAARAGLQQVRNALAANANPPGPDATPLRTALVAASQYGIRGAFSSTPIQTPSFRDEMIERGRNALAEVDRRITLALAQGLSDAEIAAAVFGSDFVLLPEFVPDRTIELAQALAQSPALIGSSQAVATWLLKTAPVRPPLASFRTMSLYARASGASDIPFAVAQVPFAAGASWVALPFANEADRPPAGLVSIVMQRFAAPQATEAWAGLLLDEWSEIIPSAAEQAGVALQYDNPRAEAPRAVLLVVPPVQREMWEFDDLVESLRETLQLAKVRAADLELLGALGQLVPALCIAANAAGDAISADLSSMLAQTQKAQS